MFLKFAESFILAMQPLYSRKKTDLTSADPIQLPLCVKQHNYSTESSPTTTSRDLRQSISTTDVVPSATVITVTESNCNSYRRIVRQCHSCQILYSSFHTCGSSSRKMWTLFLSCVEVSRNPKIVTKNFFRRSNWSVVVNDHEEWDLLYRTELGDYIHYLKCLHDAKFCNIFMYLIDHYWCIDHTSDLFFLYVHSKYSPLC